MQHVLDYVREYGRDRETLNFIYVVDDQRQIDRRPADARVPASAAYDEGERDSRSKRSWR